MKQILLISAIGLLLQGCTAQKESSDIIYINKGDTYNSKEILLEDIAEIEYIQIKVDDDYLFQSPPFYISKETIAIHDRQNGYFLFFTGGGEFKSKFCNSGNGPNEYSFVQSSVYDPKSNEIFIQSDKKILVYSVEGTFKRSFTLPEDTQMSEMVDYDSNSLLVYSDSNNLDHNFIKISKSDGAIVEYVPVPKGENINLYIMDTVGGRMSLTIGPQSKIVKYQDGYLLSNHNIDTVYLYHNDVITPSIIKTPPIQTMDPYIYLNGFAKAGKYLFYREITVKNDNGRLRSNYLVYDTETMSIYKQKVILRDYDGKIEPISPDNINNTANPQLGFIQLNIEELKDAYAQGKLHGTLADLVKSSGDDANNVFMILHFKE